MSCCGVFIMSSEAASPAGQAPRPPRPLTGRFVLILCVAFFGIVAAVNGVMMTYAITTMPGLDAANGYVASQRMNREFDAMRQQAERGWKADVAVALRNGDAPVSLALTDRDGRPVTGLAVTARLAHPALTRADHIGLLTETGPGLYAAVVPRVQPGAWTLVLEAERAGQRVFASRNRIMLKDTPL